MIDHLESFTTLALAATAAAGAARRENAAFTVCELRGSGGFLVMPSNLFAVLREHDAVDDRVPLASFLPSGLYEVHPAGRDYPCFGSPLPCASSADAAPPSS